MDVGSLRNELEEHLKNNPDEHAPHGFRDRFDATVEDLESAGSDECRKALEGQLHQIRVEAEAAVKCACGDSGEPAAPEAAAAPEAGHVREAEAPAPGPKVDDHGAAASAAADVGEAKVDDHGAAESSYAAQEEPEQGLLQRYGLLLVVALVVVIAAAYYFRG